MFNKTQRKWVKYRVEQVDGLVFVNREEAPLTRRCGLPEMASANNKLDASNAHVREPTSRLS